MDFNEVKAYAVGEVVDVADMAKGGVKQGSLKTPKEVAKLIRKGDIVQATWLDDDGTTHAQMVGVVPMPNGSTAIAPLGLLVTTAQI